MKLNASKLFRLALTGTAGLAFAQSVEAVTLLGGTGQSNNSLIPANHGSNAVGTPDITLNWATTPGGNWQAYNSWPNAGTGGQAYQVDGNFNGTITFTIAFTPTASYAVLLTSLTLNDWTGAGSTTLNWSVTGSTSGVLASGTGLVVADATFPTLNVNQQGVGGETLTLAITPTSGAGSYFAIDNISFDQVTAVPEPAGAVLAAGGLGALALRRRRRA